MSPIHSAWPILVHPRVHPNALSALLHHLGDRYPSYEANDEMVQSERGLHPTARSALLGALISAPAALVGLGVNAAIGVNGTGGARDKVFVDVGGGMLELSKYQDEAIWALRARTDGGRWQAAGAAESIGANGVFIEDRTLASRILGFELAANTISLSAVPGNDRQRVGVAYTTRSREEANVVEEVRARGGDGNAINQALLSHRQNIIAGDGRTTANQRSFAGRLIDAGKMTLGQTAHHIVPIGDKNRFAIRTRALLDKFGIDINSLDNGLGLTNHGGGRHAGGYSEVVFARLNGRRTANTIKSRLADIGRELQANDLAGNNLRVWTQQQLANRKR